MESEASPQETGGNDSDHPPIILDHVGGVITMEATPPATNCIFWDQKRSNKDGGCARAPPCWSQMKQTSHFHSFNPPNQSKHQHQVSAVKSIHHHQEKVDKMSKCVQKCSSDSETTTPRMHCRNSTLRPENYSSHEPQRARLRKIEGGVCERHSGSWSFCAQVSVLTGPAAPPAGRWRW